MIHDAGETLDEAKLTVAETIRANPLAAALIGAGVAWLYLRGRANRDTYRGRQIRTRSVTEDPYQGNEYGGAYGYSEIEESSVRARAGEAASQVMGAVNHAAQEVRDNAFQLAHRAGRGAVRVERDVQRSMQRTMEEKPLLLGAVAVAVGVGIGMALPTTRKEQQLLGPTRDRLLESARDHVRDLAGETMAKVQRVAEDATLRAEQALANGKRASHHTF